MDNQQAQSKTPQQRGGKPQWTVVKTIEDKETGLAVTITALALFKGTEYNWELLQKRSNQQGLSAPAMSRHIRPRNDSANPGLVSIAKDGMRAARLIDEALLWIEGQKQFDVDNAIEQKQYYENRAIEREQRGPKKQGGLSQFVEGSKTEREAGKRAKHEQNLAARRAADQERTRMTKGKG